MNNVVEFIKFINDIKEVEATDYQPKTYFAFLSLDKKQVKINENALNSGKFSYVFVFANYKWGMNISCKLIGMFDNKYNVVDEIKFDKLELTGFEFDTNRGTYYNAFKPCPLLCLFNNKSKIQLNLLDTNLSIQQIQSVINIIWEKEKEYNSFSDSNIAFYEKGGIIYNKDAYKWNYNISRVEYCESYDLGSNVKLSKGELIIYLNFFNEYTKDNTVEEYQFTENGVEF